MVKIIGNKVKDTYEKSWKIYKKNPVMISQLTSERLFLVTYLLRMLKFKNTCKNEKLTEKTCF